MGWLGSSARRMPGAIKDAAIAASATSVCLLLGPLLAVLHVLNHQARVHGWLGWSKFQADAMSDAINASLAFVEVHLFALGLAVSLAVPLGLLARTLARARLRAGFADPLDAIRAWTTAHPQGTRAIVAAPALASLGAVISWVIHSVRHWGDWSMYGEYAGTPLVNAMHATFNGAMTAFGGLLAVGSVAVYYLSRAGLRGLQRPTSASEKGVEEQGRVHFDAVAVTVETRAAIVGMALLPLVALLAARGLPQAGTELVLAAYVTAAIGGVLAFRRASRIAIGFDGIYVGGSSRAKFFAYTSLDAARVTGNDLELLRGDQVIVRLQLHGKDATQRAAVLRRIQASITSSRDGLTSAAGQVIQGASEGQLELIAGGATDYRAPALTRSQLWAVVEGPEHDTSTRAAAARALALTGDDGERARLRVAAEHHAEPRSRLVLEELATREHEPDDEHQAAALAYSARRR